MKRILLLVVTLALLSTSAQAMRPTTTMWFTDDGDVVLQFADTLGNSMVFGPDDQVTLGFTTPQPGPQFQSLNEWGVVVNRPPSWFTTGPTGSPVPQGRR